MCKYYVPSPLAKVMCFIFGHRLEYRTVNYRAKPTKTIQVCKRCYKLELLI